MEQRAPIKHYNITIVGKVQGVFFRKHAVEQAANMGLKGFVRNEPNGDVYCEIEGEENVLKRFELWCWKGSPLAQVTTVIVSEGALQHFQTIEIRRKA
jgi:acylphosphatase